MGNQFSFKEIEQAVLKTTYPIEINGKKIAAGEVIAAFDNIQLADFQEVKSSVTAHGGYEDRTLIIWESTKGINLTFTQGIFNELQLAIMTNSRLVSGAGNEIIEIHQRESHLTESDGSLIIKHCPQSNLFVYDLDGNKIEIPSEIDCYELIDGTWKLELNGEANVTRIIDYNFTYDNSKILMVGNNLTNTFLSFEGRTRVQDDISGNFRSGIIKIPKLKLMSELSIRLGTTSNPVVGTFKAIGLPVGERGREEVARLIFLEDDIDSDI